MNVTPRKMIYDAFRALGVMRPGQGPDDESVDDALRLMNDLLEAWQLERLMVYGITSNAYTIPSGNVYTLGTAGTLGATCPVKIDSAGWAGTPHETPVRVLTAEEYRRGVQGIYPDNGYPVTTLHIIPQPAAGRTLNLWTWAPIASFDYPDAVHNLPPGYARAIRWNLAMELAPSALIQRKIPEVLLNNVAAQAVESKAAIKSFHSTPPPTMDASDGGMLACCGGTCCGYDIRTDSY